MSEVQYDCAVQLLWCTCSHFWALVVGGADLDCDTAKENNNYKNNYFVVCVQTPSEQRMSS